MPENLFIQLDTNGLTTDKIIINTDTCNVTLGHFPKGISSNGDKINSCISTDKYHV